MSVAMSANVLEHPAVKAWCELQPSRVEPTHIETLKWRKNRSWVYRLSAVGPGGSAVIAKRRWRSSLMIERVVYQEVLSQLNIPSPRYFGFVDEHGTEFGWMFVEDAGGTAYSPLIEEHRVAAGRWLGAVHVAVAKIDRAFNLPPRTSDYYLDFLRTDRDAILQNRHNPALSSSDLACLDALLSQFDLLESNWSWMEELCHRWPNVLVHGDFGQVNVHLRHGPQGLALVVFDWEDAGWGVPAVDLAQFLGIPGAVSVSPDIMTYWSAARESWPDLGLEDMLQLAHIGAIFQSLVGLCWKSWSLSPQYSEWLPSFMEFAGALHGQTAEAIRASRWNQ